MEAPDSELMSRLAAGDDLALSELMRRWSARVSAFLYRMTGRRDTAVDLAQETFVKLYQARFRYKPQGNFSTYLFAIAANLARNNGRWMVRHPTISLDATDADGAENFPEPADLRQTPAEAALARDQTAAVNRAILALPLDLREAITLFIHEDFGYAEIAELTGCSSKAVETRIYRARQILKEQLKHLRS